MIELRIYERDIHRSEVLQLLVDPTSVMSESVGVEVDFSDIDELVNRFRDGDKRSRISMDVQAHEIVHKLLRGIDRRTLTQMNLWHWLCLNPLRDFILVRWLDIHDSSTPNNLIDSEASRFVGAQTLHGISRNAVARLWWGAETLSERDDYSLSRIALSNQDFFQQAFDRKFGLSVPASRAFFRTLEDSTESERREAGVCLNHYFTTIAGSWLIEEDVVELIKA
jgi:hypothetical protein